MVNRREEFANVAFEYPESLCVIHTYSIRIPTKGTHRSVCALAEPARIRIRCKGTVEEWVELAVDSVVEQSVAHARFMYVAGLWIINLEVRVVTMLIRPGNKVGMES